MTMEGGDEEDREVVFLDEAVPAVVAGSSAEEAALRAAELATAPDDVSVLARLLARPDPVPTAERLLAGDFPSWARPRGAATRAPPQPDALAAVIAEARHSTYEAYRRALAEADPLVASKPEAVGLVVPAAERPVDEEVVLEDGLPFRLAAGTDAVPVTAVEFAPDAPEPRPTGSKAPLTPAGLKRVLPSRADVLAHAAKVAAKDGLDAALEAAAAHGVEPTDGEFAAIAKKAVVPDLTLDEGPGAVAGGV